jgi:hypothetical protein
MSIKKPLCRNGNFIYNQQTHGIKHYKLSYKKGKSLAFQAFFLIYYT